MAKNILNLFDFKDERSGSGGSTITDLRFKKVDLYIFLSKIPGYSVYSVKSSDKKADDR